MVQLFSEYEINESLNIKSLGEEVLQYRFENTENKSQCYIYKSVVFP